LGSPFFSAFLIVFLIIFDITKMIILRRKY
jgi:hypothetical protein